MPVTIRPIEPEEFVAFSQTIAYAFHFDPSEEDRAHLEERLEFDRTVAAFDGDELVGTGGAFSLRLTVPGGAPVATGGTTVISVRPTHRRRGVLRAMMSAHLDEVAGRAEPLAALWSSDSGIYGRFGYGPASYQLHLEVDKEHVEFAGPAPPGRVDLLDEEEALPMLMKVFDPVAARRAGMFSRDERWWRLALLHDPESWRDGWSAQRFAVYREGGQALGYAIYRTKGKWERGHGVGEARVGEMVAGTTAAREGLWRYLCGLDLVAQVRARNAPVDEELPWLLVNPRRVQTQVSDALWVRLMDVPAALAARAYRVPGRVVLAVSDEAFPGAAGVYELDGGPDGAECRPTDAEPDLSLDAMALGAAYLGGNSMAALARAGHVTGDPDAVALADLMFAWHEPPWCQEVF